jgi:hypothetical protein
MHDDAKHQRKEERARKHPLRVKILGLYEQDESCSLAASDLMRGLGEEGTNVSAVAYHVRILQDAKLLPVQQQT